MAQLKNLPKEFPKNSLNKIYCGEEETHDSDYRNYNILKWKLTVSEAEGIFVEYNDNAKFKNEWHKTQTIKTFEFWKRETLEDRYGDPYGEKIYYKIKETKPGIKLDDIYTIDDIVLSINYERSSEYLLCVKIFPNHWIYASDQYFSSKIKTAKELEDEKQAKQKEEERIKKEQEQQDLQTMKLIENYLKSKDTKSAYEEYEKLNKSSSVVLDKIQNMVKSNNAEIGRLLSEKKIEQALDLYLITGRDDELLNKIKSALAEKYPEPQTPLDNSKLVSLLSSNALTEIRSMAFKPDLKIYLTIQKDGQAILKNGTSVLKQFKVEEKYISSNTYKDILYKVDANYPITLDVDSLNYSIYGLELSKDFLQFKSDIDAKKLAYYYVKNGDKTLILSKVSDGNDVSKKYPGAQRIYNFEFSNEYSGKQARLINTCPLKVNGQAFSTVNFKSKNFITTFKKFK